jgi:hypothetical protein
VLKVVSVSLGSAKRNKTTRTELLNTEFELTRIGTDGNLKLARELIQQLDGKVAAIGLGGIDLYLLAGNRRYVIRDARKLALSSRLTPVVDGSDLKLLLESRIVEELLNHNLDPPLAESKVLQVSALDRYGMASKLEECSREIIFGDALYALGINLPLNRLRSVEQLARVLLPVLSRMPFRFLYPTGKKQEQGSGRYSEYFTWADWICGDFHYIRRNMPQRLNGKIVLTNTTTEEDTEMLAERGLKYLITTTPVIDGRSFGMNVLEACIVALIREQDDFISQQTLQVYLNKLNLGPTIKKLN